MAHKPKAFRIGGRPTAAQSEREYDRDRYRNKPGRDLYGTARWKRERASFLADPENQFCKRCLSVGILNPGHLTKDGDVQSDPRRMHLVVHHTQRHHGDPEVFWDRTKWEPICPDHHDSDAQAEERAAGRV